MRKRPRPPRDELIVDNFAGGGGTSTGIEMALRRSPNIAINHDPVALAMHQANHPLTRHYPTDVFEIDPRAVTLSRPVGLAWFSPDCCHFSKAKGGQPVSKRVRGLAWVVIKWATQVRPRVIVLENVEEFVTRGPLGPDSKPDAARKGKTFASWVAKLRRLGYAVEWRELRACDYGAPTIRKRLFVIARCDGLPIVWPAPTHSKGGVGGLLPWRAAAEIIDWSLPCHSIFLSPEEARAVNVRRPLKPATLRRIAAGIMRYVVNHPDPFLVSINHGESGGRRVYPLTDPLRTVTGSRGEALIAPCIDQQFGTSRGAAATDPLGTVMPNAGGGKYAAVAAIDDVERSEQVWVFLAEYYSQGGQFQDCRAPLNTVTVRDRFGLIVGSISDISMRMLRPRELFLAQGFPANYRIDVLHPRTGKPLTKGQQTKCVGNSVSPNVAAAIVAANVPDLAINQIRSSWRVTT